MPDGFNIAVAQFALTGEAAKRIPAETGWNMGDWLARSIETERTQYLNILVNEVWGPDEVGVIPGEDPDTRAVNAAQFADRYNVNILIYGVITGSHNSYFAVPEFYVASKGFDYASEVAGPDQLGRQVPLHVPFEDPDKNDLNNELKARRRILQHVVYGLGYLYFNNYTEAFEEFEDASIEKQGGLEVVSLLMGAAKLREYNNTPCEQRAQALNQAEDNFTQAFRLDQSYVRTYLGLGSVAMEQAKIFNADCTSIVGVHSDKLLRAKNWYSNSLSLKTDGRPALASVPVKAAFGLGLVHSLGAKYDPADDWSIDEARRFFQQAAAGYKPEQPPDLTWLAGQAHANLCLLAELNKDWPTVLCECQEAIELLNTLPGNWFSDNKIAKYQAEIVFAQEKLKSETTSNPSQATQQGQNNDTSCGE